MNDSHVDMSLPVAVDRCAQASFHEPPLFFQTLLTVNDGSSFGWPL